MRYFLALLAGAGLVGGLTACVGGPPSAGPGPVATPTLRPVLGAQGGVATSPQPAAGTSPVVAGGAILTFVQSGSTPEQRVALAVRTDGTAVVESSRGRRETVLTPAEMAMLREEMANADFFRLQSDYPVASTASGFTYSITYTHGTQSKSVVFRDGSVLPPQLQTLRVVMQSLVRRVETS